MEKVLLLGEEIASDDDLRRLIEGEGYETRTAIQPQEAFAMMQAELPAVVIVEHQLAEEDGVVVLKRILAEHPICEVILVTDQGDMEAAIEVLQAGALDYIRRPLDLERVHIALGRARAKRRQKQVLSEPRSILVIEDHDTTRRRVTRVLEKEGYRVVAASDGEEGLRLFNEGRFDLILADIRMPRRDGLSVLRETKGKGADVEVIMVTGYGDEEVVVQALRDGAVNFLKKPIDIEQMLVAIEKALDYQTVRRSLAYRDRDAQLMQELVVRLTSKLEIVFETPGSLSKKAFDFLCELVNSLPFGIVVIASDRSVIFANSHVTQKTGPDLAQLSPDWLEPMGIPNLSQEKLAAAFDAMMKAKPGTIETLVVSKWAFLVMTPITIVRPDLTERYVALAIRGERKMK